MFYGQSSAQKQPIDLDASYASSAAGKKDELSNMVENNIVDIPQTNPFELVASQLSLSGDGKVQGECFLTFNKFHLVLPMLPEGCDERNTRITIEIDGQNPTFDLSGKTQSPLCILPIKRILNTSMFVCEFDENLEDQILFPLKVAKLKFAIGLKIGHDLPILLDWSSLGNSPQVNFKIYSPKLLLAGL